MFGTGADIEQRIGLIPPQPVPFLDCFLRLLKNGWSLQSGRGSALVGFGTLLFYGKDCKDGNDHGKQTDNDTQMFHHLLGGGNFYIALWGRRSHA
jgi:hypothetical protein